jgi:PAS domain S-box-containing protein
MFSTHYKMPHRPDQRALQLLDLLARQAADIIERTQAEAAVLESERRLRSVLDNMSEGLMLFDAQGDVIYQNAVSLRIHGFEPRKEDERVEGEFLKATWKGWDDKDRPLPPDEWPMSRIFREERFENQILHAQRVETGYEFDASYNGSPLYDSAGNLIGGFITIRDITDHKRAQDALIRSEKLASVGRMAATVAHEINNPLEAVMSLLFLAKENKELPESVRQYLETADAELNRIAHITRQSLGFYRESNAPAVTSVNAVLESAVDLLKSKIKAKQAVIEKQWHGDMQVTAVAGELRQVFSNLLANSLDAIDAKGTIKVRVSTGAAFKNGDRCVRVTVADNGKGISPSSRQHLFEPFFTTKGTVGTGLGLWVSKQIVEKHGGTIRMRSSGNAARKGAVFSVVLPVMSAVARRQSAGA